MRLGNDDRPGCLMGLMELFALNKIYNWAQETFGAKSGSCLGCGCGIVIFVIAIIVFCSIVFGTDWFDLTRLPLPLC